MTFKQFIARCPQTDVAAGDFVADAKLDLTFPAGNVSGQ